MVYGLEQKKVKIEFLKLPKPFDIESETISISSSKEQNVYFWYQLLQIVSKNTIAKVSTDSEISTELVKSFAILTDEFINFTKTRNKASKVHFKYKLSNTDSSIESLLAQFKLNHSQFLENEIRLPVPRIGSILEVFGNWLFFYANCDFLYCEKGRAKAIGALCRLFSSNLGPVSEEHAGKFYKTIFYIMKGGVSPIVIKNILKHSTSLMSAEIPGIKILFDKDYLFKAISFSLNDKKSDSRLRKYCYEIVSCFIGSINYLNKIEIIKQLYDLLLDSIQNENDPLNFKILV